MIILGYQILQSSQFSVLFFSEHFRTTFDRMADRLDGIHETLKELVTLLTHQQDMTDITL
jgi:hypothetical protein